MLTRPLGRTGLNVSEIGFGCASFWGNALFSEREAIDLVHAAADNGVTFFDTGSIYSGGQAEVRLGRALAGLKSKHDLVVATKAGTRLGAWNRPYRDYSPAWIRQSVDESLARLGLDRIALLLLHGPRVVDLNDELLATLADLRAAGKVGHIGVNVPYDPPVIERVMTLPLFEVVMVNYSILWPERAPTIRALAERGIGVLASMALAGGLYSEQRLHIHGIRDVWYALRLWKHYRPALQRGRRYRFVNHVPGWTGGQIVLAWLLSDSHVACAVFGTTRMAHVMDNLKASGRTLDDAVAAQIRKVQSSSSLFLAAPTGS